MLFSLVTACDKGEEFKGEYITRNQGEKYFTPLPLRKCPRKAFEWEASYGSHFPRITKDFFRCHGSPHNPTLIEGEGEKRSMIRDCRGSDRHGLPLREGKEFVYPCLIELLNYVQEKSQRRVVITCGHTCPDHSSYIYPTKRTRASKHLIGAEVDFYVEGLQNAPQKVVALLQRYYQENPDYKDHAEYTTFKRDESDKQSVLTPAWYNKEIQILLSLGSERRDLDNAHAYPYITLQVRYDREKMARVSYDDKQARNYLRN